ncbi:hypothetical protein BH09SUM1_BH09SUM1_30880 [soil metagenome]
MKFNRRLGYDLRKTAQGWSSNVTFRLGGSHKKRQQMHRAMKALGSIGYGAFVEPSLIETTQVDIVIPDLPRALDGYRIAHLTDIHYNFAAGKNFLRRVVDKTKALDPDMVALTGDFITHKPGNLHRCMSLLSDLNAPDGCWVTRGNHDYKASLESMREACKGAGFRLLENQHATIRPARQRTGAPSSEFPAFEHSINIAGVGDLWEGLCLPGRALEGADTAHPTILLSHNPQAANLLCPGMRADVMLSGHTHGGQIRPMGRKFAMLSDGSTTFVSGLVETEHTKVYISRGVGTSAFRFRWNCRPEIALIRLHRSGG